MHSASRPKHPNPRTAPHLMDMINVEAAFVILSNATDPELASALQQNSGLRHRVQRILEFGPPPRSTSNAPPHQRQAQQRQAQQQVPQGWPDGPLPAMASTPSTPAAQFGGQVKAMHPTPAHALGQICQRHTLTRKVPTLVVGHSTISGKTTRSTPETLGISNLRKRSLLPLRRKAKASRARPRKAKAN